MEKYKIIKESRKWIGGEYGNRILALRDIPTKGVKAGDVGGWLGENATLSQEGDSWIGYNAIVCGHAAVSENAGIYDNAVIGGHANICGDAAVYGNAAVYLGRISGDARVCGMAQIYHDIDMTTGKIN